MHVQSKTQLETKSFQTRLGGTRKQDLPPRSRAEGTASVGGDHGVRASQPQCPGRGDFRQGTVINATIECMTHISMCLLWKKKKNKNISAILGVSFPFHSLTEFRYCFRCNVF